MSEKKSLPELYTEKVFKGKIELDTRDSTPDWDPYLPPIAPKDAPNVPIPGLTQRPVTAVAVPATWSPRNRTPWLRRAGTEPCGFGI